MAKQLSKLRRTGGLVVAGFLRFIHVPYMHHQKHVSSDQNHGCLFACCINTRLYIYVNIFGIQLQIGILLSHYKDPHKPIRSSLECHRIAFCIGSVAPVDGRNHGINQ